ncbi:YolD-like family protein [Planococcus rifietoensis]|uniref:YolD-like family protein n=1 Tax=Planococcus rifietoensis TaxID=200991 RepID=UPI00384E845A
MMELSINRDRKMVGDVQDRGALKWTSLMLPEHIRMLREWKEEDNRVPKPELDEFDLQQIEEELDLAFKRRCEVLIKSWKDYKIIEHRGKIEQIDLHGRQLFYTNLSGRQRLAVDEIVAVSSTE